MSATTDAIKLLNDFISVADAIPPCIPNGGTKDEATALQQAIETLGVDITGENGILANNPQFQAAANLFGMYTSLTSLQTNANNLVAAFGPTGTTLDKASALTGVISNLAALAQGTAEIAEIPAAATGGEATLPLTGFAAACAAVKLAATGTQFAIDALNEGYFAAVDQGNNIGPVQNFTIAVAWDINAEYTVNVIPLSGGNLSATITNVTEGSVNLSQSPNEQLVASISGNIGSNTAPMAYVAGADVTVGASTTGTIQGSDDTITVGSSAQIAITGYDNKITTGAGDAITAEDSNVTLPSNTLITLSGSQLNVYGVNSSGTTLTLPFQNYTNVTVVNPGDGGLVAYNVPTSGSGTVTINGTPIPVSGLGEAVNIQDIACAPGVSPDQVIADLVTRLGDPLTAAQWDQDYIDYLNPTGTRYTVSGSVSGTHDTFTISSSSSPGASVTGVSGYTNILDVAGDITQDSISNIQQVNIEGALTMTAAEWSTFAGLGGLGGAITVASSGTFSLSGTTGDVSSLTAEDWGGTTLTGNNTSGQTLTASLFGNDTLNAGNGGGTLVAGEGVDTLNGGTSGDAFYADYGLAAGSSVTGRGTGNILYAYYGSQNVDISGATVTGIQTLEANNITLNATELAGFSTVVLAGAGLTLNAKGAGSYSLAGVSSGSGLAMNTDATDNQNLTGDNQGYNELKADNSSGDDDLTVSDTSGSTGNNTLSAQNTTGDDTLTAGSGANDILNVNSSFGNDTLTAGNGNNDLLEAQNSLGNNSLTAGNGNNDTLNVNGSSGNNTLTAGNGNNYILEAQNSAGNNTLNAGSGNNTLDATGSTGTNTFNGGSGSDTEIAGLGVSIMNGSTAGGTTFDVASGLEAGSSVTGYGTGNTLNASGNLSAATISGVQTLDISGSVTLTAAQLAGIATLDLTGTGVTATASGAGTFSFSPITDDDLTVIADPTASDTLIGGYYVTSIDADDTSGNDTLDLGSTMGGLTASARYSTGNDTLTVEASYALGDILDITGSTGNDTLSAGNDDTLIATGSSGNDTLSATGYENTFYAGNGVDTITGGVGENDFIFTSRAAAGTTVTGGTDGYDDLDAETTDISGATLTNVVTLVDYSASLTLTGAEFNGFTTFVNGYGSGATLVVVGSGTYSMSGKTVVGSAFTLVTDSGSTVTGNNSNGQVLYAAATGTSTVDAGTGTGDVLYAEGGTDTLNAGSGGDTLYDGTGTATLNGGSGADTFYVSNPMGGTTVNAGTGDTVYVSGNTGSGAVTDTINMSGGTLYVGAGADADIYGSNNTIITSNNSAVGSHNGGDNTVSEGDSSGVWLLDDGGDTVDAGTGDYIFVSGNGTGDEDNVVNISGGSVDIQTNTQTDVFGSNNSITVGANDLAGAHSGDDNTVTIADNVAFWLSDSGGSTVTGGTGDYVSVSGNGTNGDDNIVNTSDSDIAIDNDTQADVVGAGNSISVGTDSVSGVNGNDNTISLGSGTYYWVNGGTGNTVTASSYNTVTVGGGLGVTLDGGGNDSYEFGSTFAASTIDNNASGGLTAANGVLGFGSGISDESLWFKESGNNLLIDLLGTTDQITVDNWFGSNAGAQLSEIDADGLKLTTQVASLVSAMATYAAANSGFNPQTATSMPTNTTLQNAIAASWHS